MTERLAADLQADELSRYSLLSDLPELVAANEILLLLELDHPLVAVSDFVGVLVERHVAAVGEDPALDPPDVARTDR